MEGVRWFVVGFLVFAFSGNAWAQDLIRVGGFSRDAVSRIAEGKGFLEQAGIRAEYTQVRASVELMRNFAGGTFDVIHTTPDNVIAWAEGQGADRQPHDFLLFVGGRKGITNELVVGPEITTFDDLKGKVLAVDAYNTGYAPVLVYILKRHGLTLKKDYEMKPVGGGGMRAEAIKRGEAVGGFVSLDEELKRRGYKVLARAKDYVPRYAGGAGAARREWAERNRKLLVRYIRALVRATDWLLEPANKAEAIQVLQAVLENSSAQAEQLYQESVDPQFGFFPRSQMDREGIQVILELREVMGEMKPPLSPPDKYIDESYYREAMTSP